MLQVSQVRRQEIQLVDQSQKLKDQHATIEEQSAIIKQQDDTIHDQSAKLGADIKHQATQIGQLQLRFKT